MEEKALCQLFSPIGAAVSGKLNRNPALKRDPAGAAGRELARGRRRARKRRKAQTFSAGNRESVRKACDFSDIWFRRRSSRDPSAGAAGFDQPLYSAARAKVSNGVKPVAPRIDAST